MDTHTVTHAQRRHKSPRRVVDIHDFRLIKQIVRWRQNVIDSDLVVDDRRAEAGETHGRAIRVWH